jgi:Flp pilus assembly protein TadD
MAGSWQSLVERVPLGRGITWELTLQLFERKGHDIRGTGARVVSTAELQQSVPASAEKEYKLALKLVAKGEVSQAAGHFQQAIALYPEYLAARNDLGAQYLKLKRLDEAEEHFLLVLERDPKNFYAIFNLGLVRIERRDYADAVSKLHQAIASDSTWPTARLWLGFALLEMGDLPAAERELTKALIMGGPDCVVAHYHLARAYVKRGDPAEASRAIKAYLEESPRGEYVKEAKELARKLGNDKQAGTK